MEKPVFCFLSIDAEILKRQLVLLVFGYYDSRIKLFYTIISHKLQHL